ncbi:response regulator [Luteimonas sp. SX5]|uniref:Response regulator n=1 Tax=Luteimonas galliterrae TaxID=2940486 RepID=A0ABT0MGK8_9GAMM|nr:response regulator [Luteimonas galliterrae]MCL1634002.1 response regulator [Luteimonas galliterrae]
MQDANAMKPRLLLVEDDPASRAFMAAVIAALPAEVDTAASVGTALTLATTRQHELWLFDVRLPDGDGVDLLARLRKQGMSTPALAHTASRDPDEHAALLQAGFLATLTKPFAAAELREAIASTLGRNPAPVVAERSAGAAAVWDDERALAALNGNREHVAALRAMFLAELPDQRSAVLAALAQGDTAAARSVLHRLKASCGFVGAASLKSSVERLDAAMHDRARADEFARIVERTLAG